MVSSRALTGKAWVLDFFAAYCAPCHERFAVLRDVARQATVIGVSVDEDIDSATAQVSRFGIPFSVIHDPAHIIAGKFRVTILPVTFLIDASLRVAWVADERMPRERFSVGLRQNIAAAGVGRT